MQAMFRVHYSAIGEWRKRVWQHVMMPNARYTVVSSLPAVILANEAKAKATFVSFTWTVASKDDTVIYPALDIITCWGIRFKHFAFTEQCVQNDSVLVSCKLLHLCSFVVSCAMVKRKWHEIARKYPMFGIFMYINNSYFRHILIKV